MRLRFLLLLAPIAAGCVGRSVADGSGGASEVDDEDVGMRPESGMYAECFNSEACEPLDLCVFPSEESGYCTAPCVAPDDASECAASPGGSAVPFCLDIGIPDGSRVCALDCAGGKSCPGGMRCEGIDTNEGEQRVCF